MKWKKKKTLKFTGAKNPKGKLKKKKADDKPDNFKKKKADKR